MIDSSGQRLSRRDRRRLKINQKARVALGLAVVLCLLIGGRIFWRDIMGIIPNSIFHIGDKVPLQVLADSLVVMTAEDFHLSDTVAVDSQFNQPGGPAYKQLRLSWPKDVPFMFYAGRLERRGAENNLTCDCIESSTNRQMTCELSRDGHMGARIILEADNRSKLVGRDFGILVKNIGAWKNDDILGLAEQGIRFTYAGSPDTYPAARVKRKMESAGIESILEIPAKNVGLIATKSKKKDSDKDKGGSYRNLIIDLFGRHPGPKALLFDRSQGYDTEFVKAALEVAEERNIAFIYENPKPDEIDSLAYSGGLVILSAKNIAEFGKNKGSGLEAEILNQIIGPGSPKRAALVCDAGDIEPSMIASIYGDLQKLGVNIKYYTDLADTLKSF